MKIVKRVIPAILLILMITACSDNSAILNEQGMSDLESESSESQNETLSGDSASEQAYTEILNDEVTSSSISAEHTELHEDSEDYIWDIESLVSVQLNGDSITTESSDITINGTTATIKAAGNYSFSGSLADGQIVVDTEDEAIVRIILNGADIHSSVNSAIYVQSAEKVLVVLAEGSQNSLSDESNYTLPEAESDEPNATLFSKADLTITGNGSLTITANYNDAIASKDGLIVNGGSTITINAVDDGIHGKDYLVINNAGINVTSSGDGLKSDEADDASKGFITIESGTITVVAGADAIDAESDVTILDGNLNLQSGGGGSANIANMESSAKGIIGGTSVTISGGNISIDSADDAIHSNGTVLIQGGTFTIASGDDGIHSDTSLTIDGGSINITKSYEGLESATITINGGDIQIEASDDGINVAGGTDGSGMTGGMQGDKGGGKHGGQAGPGQDMFTTAGSYYLYINGGSIFVNADGDGIDSNGSIEMTGGTVVVNGPTNNANGALDYMSTFNITGGYFIAAGSSGMAQAPSNSSSQASVYLNFNGTVQSGQIIHVENSAGETIFNFSPMKEIQNIVFSSPNLQTGGSYTIMIGGEISGTSSNLLLSDAAYSGGSEYTSFSITDIVTQIGSGGGMFRH